MQKLKLEEANEHWWYRLVKASYIVFVVLVALVGIFFAYTLRPEVNYLASKYSVRCNDSGYTTGNFDGTDLERAYIGQPYTFEEPYMTIVGQEVCKRGGMSEDEISEYITNEYAGKNYRLAELDAALIENEPNYTIVLTEKEYWNSWSTYSGYVGGAIFMFFLIIGFGIPATFRYVLFGRLW